MPKIRELSIYCRELVGADALLQVCAKASNLERILLKVPRCSDSVTDHMKEQDLLQAVSTFKGIVYAVRMHPKLERFEFTGRWNYSRKFEELREAVQCM